MAMFPRPRDPTSFNPEFYARKLFLLMLLPSMNSTPAPCPRTLCEAQIQEGSSSQYRLKIPVKHFECPPTCKISKGAWYRRWSEKGQKAGENRQNLGSVIRSRIDKILFPILHLSQYPCSLPYNFAVALSLWYEDVFPCFSLDLGL